VSSDSEFEIPYIDFGGSGEVIHFAHANGFPPKTYSSLAQELSSNYRVIGMELRPLWPNSDYKTFKNWETAADDLIRYLDQQKLFGIIGMGHSFGAIATLIAANKRPDLFKKLVFIEPVVLPTWVYTITWAFPKYLLRHANPLVKQTLNRTNKWESREAAFQQFRSKKVFSKIAEKELWDYVNAATSVCNDGSVRLTFPREWEAQIYMTFSLPWKYFKALKFPYLVIRGETSDTITDSVWKKWVSSNQNGTLLEMKNLGHLLPLEAPGETSIIVLKFLAEH
jgi:pimeloyl-ACP methyl ester carboxylesterase